MQPTLLTHMPGKPPLELCAMPAENQSHGVRMHFAGTGVPGAPLVHGWFVSSHKGPNGGVAHDDMTCGEDAFEQ